MEGSPLDFVEHLNSGKDFWNMKARVIRVWKQSFRWDMIVIDERGSKIQACIKNHLLPQFAEFIKEDAILLIRKFGITDQKDRHRIIDLDHKINFFKCTHVQSVVGFSGHPYGFRFIPFNDILNLNTIGALTVDVIGRVAWMGDLEIFKSGGKESKRINVDLQDYDGNVLRCTLWGGYAEQCIEFVDSNRSREMVIVVIQHGRVKPWGGQQTVQNDMFGTRLFLNEELTEANDLRRSLILKDGPSQSQHVLSSQTSYPLRDEFLTKTPRKHVDELNEINMESSFVVVATIRTVEEEAGWFYKAHRKCHKKVFTKSQYLEQAKVIPENFLEDPFDSMWCLKCTCLADSLVPKFKVQFRVQDSTGSVSFMMFDKDVSKLIGVTASDIRDRQLKTGELEIFPHELQLLNNKLLAFKILISEYNLMNKYYVYTVSKVCDDVEVIEELQCLEQPEELTADEPDQIGLNLDESSQIGPDSKDCASVTSNSLVGETEKDCVSSPFVKRDKHPIPFCLDENPDDEFSAVRPVKRKLSS